MPKLLTQSNWIVAAGLLLMLAAPGHAAQLPDFTELVEQNADAVVNISVAAQAVDARGAPRRNVPEQFEDFFRFFPRPPESRPRGSLGSGFIISEDGYILTNNHVIDKASEVIVRLSDRRELTAEVIGVDPRSDLALLKIESDGALPVVRVGKSADLKVGEWVLAIGSPFGFDYSVTAGIVSAKRRSLPNERSDNYVPFIQTDVAINPGNSGGPLFNLAGDVVGINSQIYSNSGGFMGVSFAIPIDIAMEVANQLRDTGRVSRGWLGVMIQEVDRDLAESFGLDRPHGALIRQVMEGSPALEGGLQEGDIITHFNGNSIERSSELPHYVGRVMAGADALLSVVRGGDLLELKLKIGELPDNLGAQVPVVAAAAREGANRLGLIVNDLSAEEKTRFDLDSGVAVVDVERNAMQAGVQPGDIITRLNNRSVRNVAELDEIVRELTAGRTYPVLVLRNGTPVFLPLRVPDED